MKNAVLSPDNMFQNSKTVKFTTPDAFKFCTAKDRLSSTLDLDYVA